MPRSDTLSWLRLAWYPGWPYQPVQRWVIYEMEPKLDRVSDHILMGLRGPNPREHGTWVDGEGVPCSATSTRRVRWVSASSVSLPQWQLFRDTGCAPLLFWIIQGEHGGHPWRLAPKERMLLQKRFGLSDVADPGALPYAPYDARVRRLATEGDRLRKWRHRLDWNERGMTRTRAGLWVMHDERENEEAWERANIAWLDAMIEEVVTDIPRRLLPQAVETLIADPKFAAPGWRDHQELDERLIASSVSQPSER